jgi:hypothetical protein
MEIPLFMLMKFLMTSTNNVDNNQEDKDPKDEEEQQENEFISFQSIYTDFLNLKEQIKLKRFAAVGANERYNAVARNLSNLESLLRETTHWAHCAKIPRCQLFINDCFVQI